LGSDGEEMEKSSAGRRLGRGTVGIVT